MKSCPSSDIPLNASDGNLTSHFFIFSLVWSSFIPPNGDKPLRLLKYKNFVNILIFLGEIDFNKSISGQLIIASINFKLNASLLTLIAVLQ